MEEKAGEVRDNVKRDEKWSETERNPAWDEWGKGREGRRESQTYRERKKEGVEGIAGIFESFQWKIWGEEEAWTGEL